MKVESNLGNTYLAARQLLSQLKQAKPSSIQDNLSPTVCSLLLLMAICIFCAATGSRELQLEQGWKEAAGAKYGLQRELGRRKIFWLCNGLGTLCKAHPTTGAGVRIPSIFSTSAWLDDAVTWSMSTAESILHSCRFIFWCSPLHLISSQSNIPKTSLGSVSFEISLARILNTGLNTFLFNRQKLLSELWL